jgi:two-component sensor histidine kinase
MTDDSENIRTLLRQQAALATFGTFALREPDLLKVLNEAAQVCAKGLNVPFCKVCRYRPAENDLLVVAGYGWPDGIINHVVSKADESSPQGRAFVTRLPSICNDLREPGNFTLPPFYASNGIISTIDVVIKGSNGNVEGRPYGVLEIDNDCQYNYDQHDVDFLTGFANVLAEAVATTVRAEILRSTVKTMEELVKEKDQLLEQKAILAEELQHRVRNNLQLVYGMLSQQLEETEDLAGQQGIKAIARRVTTIAQVYNQLLGTEMTSTTDFGAYVKVLCAKLIEIQGLGHGNIKLTCESEPLLLDLNMVTALGLIVAELVTNSCDHAFPNGSGAVTVHVYRSAEDPRQAVMTIGDDGVGFENDPLSKRHGLGLVRRLTEQIRGTARSEPTRGRTNGTFWTLMFPLPFSAGQLG